MTIPAPPPPPPIPALPSEADRQASSREEVVRSARDYLQDAISQLGTLMHDPKAQSAQVRACENIIAWGAGKPGRYVDIGSLKGMTVFEAVDHVISSVASGQCSLEDGEALTREQIVLNDRQRSFAGQSAESAVRGAPRLSLTRTREIAFDQLAGGVPERNLAAQTKLAANAEVVAENVIPGLGRSLTKLNNRVVNLGNSTDDLARSEAIMSGLTRGAIATGESFSPDSQLAQFRILGNLTGSLDEKGVFNLTQLFDASSRSGQGIQRLQKELFTPANQAGAGGGISKGAVANLQARGLRGFSTEEQNLFNRDPVGFIEDVLGPRLRAQGVNTNDRDALANYLRTAGFNDTSQRVINQTFQSLDERARQFQLTSGVDINDPSKGTGGNLALSFANLAASFDTFASKVLTPAAEKVAPFVNAAAEGLEKIALSASKFDDFAVAAGAAATAFGAFQGGKALFNLFNPLNASALALNGSAAALTEAAVALGGSGIAGKAGAAGAGAAGGASLASLVRFGLPVAVAVLGGYGIYKGAKSGVMGEYPKAYSQAMNGRTFPGKERDDFIPAMRTDPFADLDAERQRFRQTFETGAQTIRAEGSSAGADAAAVLSGSATEIGTQIGRAAVAQINAARVIVTPVPGNGHRVDTGATNPTE